MSNLAIIPARGGSKRIPRKNIRDFLGKPIIAYSIQTAIYSGLFDEIMVSTEDDEIAEISKSFGAEIPFKRSKTCANDYATLSDVIEEVKNEYYKRKKSFEYLCCILPTAPFVTVDILKNSLNQLKDLKADSIRPVIRYSYPIQRAVKINDGLLEMFNPIYARTRSQDLEPSYHDAGQFYWMKSSSGLKGSKKMGFEIPEIQAQDIDTEDDWRIAELKYKYFR